MKQFILWVGLMGLISFSALSQTTVNSDINTNTTWDLAGSPYHVTQDISIFSTLRIDPGVEVIVDSVTIYVDGGTLKAEGTVMDSIKIVSSIGVPSPNIQYGFKWLGFQVLSGEIVMKYVYGEFANKFFDYQAFTGPLKLTLINCTFRENRNVVYELDLNTSGGTSFVGIDSCRFIQNAYPISGNNYGVSYCTFERFDTGVNLINGFASYSTFVDNVNYSIKLGSGQIQNNLLYYTPNASAFNFGIHLDYTSPNAGIVDVKNNQIFSYYGIFIKGTPGNQLTIENNEICGDSINVWAFNDPVLDLTDNCWCSIDSAYIANKIKDNSAFFPATNSTFVPFDSSCAPNQIYPGDANYDQIANNVDLLPIGLYFGETGPARINPSLNWVAQDADPWGDSLVSTGADIKHIDTDGNGVINDDDTLAIHLNYNQTHNANRGESTSGMNLYFDMPATPVNPSDTIAIGRHARYGGYASGECLWSGIFG